MMIQKGAMLLAITALTVSMGGCGGADDIADETALIIMTSHSNPVKDEFKKAFEKLAN